MDEWSLVSEFLALLFTAIIALFFFDPQQPRSKRRNLFWSCLGLTAVSILLDIGTVFAINAGPECPIALNYAVNTAYFLVTIAMSLAITYFLVCRVFEFSSNERILKACRILLTAILVLFALLLVLNLYGGFFFSIDDHGCYSRGPLNAMVYLVPLLGAFLVCSSYIANRKSVGTAVTRIALSAPALVLLLVFFQVIFKDQLMNGTIAAVVNLVCFINFQSIRVETEPLTGISNRRSFVSEMDHRTSRKENFQIILVALRHFAQINHIYGHDGGDAMLFIVANRLRDLIPRSRVFRYNSVEFLLLMPAAGKEVQEQRIEQVQACMDKKWHLNEGAVRLQYCLAEVCNEGEQWTTEEVVEHLDYTVQLAKDEHRSLVRFDAATIRRYEREEELSHAIKYGLHNNRIEVWYQPVFYRKTGGFDSCEALLRMTDFEGKRISPDEFIPVAERNGFIDSLTWKVLEDACRVLGSGEVPGLKSVSVNLTMRQLLQENLVPRILKVLDRYGVSPTALKFEITERMVAESETAACVAMEEMRKHGFSFLLDDFGTGYSNFSMVINMPFEAVKLDRSLVSGLPDDPKSKLMAQTLSPFFHELGQDILAEGIETAEQAQMVASFGADRIQGYYLAKPMPGEALGEWYRTKAAENAAKFDPHLHGSHTS